MARQFNQTLFHLARHLNQTLFRPARHFNQTLFRQARHFPIILPKPTVSNSESPQVNLPWDV